MPNPPKPRPNSTLYIALSIVALADVAIVLLILIILDLLGYTQYFIR